MNQLTGKFTCHYMNLRVLAGSSSRATHTQAARRKSWLKYNSSNDNDDHLNTGKRFRPGRQEEQDDVCMPATVETMGKLGRSKLGRI